MRITYFADIRVPLERANGIQTFETCHALAERGHRVSLISRPDTTTPARDPLEYYGLPPSSRLVVERAPVVGPQFARRVGYLSFAAGRALGTGRTDVLFTRDLGVAALVLRLPRGLRPPLVYESHGYAPDVAAEMRELVATARTAGTRKLHRLAEREALVWREAAGYVTITKALADLLTERFGERDNLAVVPDGVRLPPERHWDPPANGHIVGYAGHLYPWKGTDVLLEALALVPSAKGLIVGGYEGEPDLPRARRLANQLGLDERVEFTGMVPPPAVADLLRRAAVLVLPNPPSATSTHFTSPLKLFEYMAAGRAIIASDLPAIREVLRDGENARLVPAGDVSALARAIHELLDSPDEANRLARRAFADAAAFGWKERAERLERVLERARATR